MKQVSYTLIFIAILGLMVFTNPTMDDYQEFARQEMRKLAERQGDDTSRALVALFGGFASGFVVGQTQRKDYVFLSMYTMQIGEERMVCIGLFRNFVILEAPEVIRSQ